MMRTAWHRLIAFGFRLLYNELAWLYEPVSWAASRGLWRRWQKSLWPYLPECGWILEVGPGPGHLLADLARVGYSPVGLDLSPAMLRVARKRLQKLQLTVRLCRGRAQALPFAGRTFDAVILTFPTPFVYEPAWLQQMVRVLKDHGHVLVVEMASFDARTPGSRLLEWLYRVTGQRATGPDLLELLRSAGLCARREVVPVDGTSVNLVVAEWSPNRVRAPLLSTQPE